MPTQANKKRKNQRSILTWFLVGIILMVGFFIAQPVLAQVDQGLQEVGRVTGFFQQDPRLILAKLVRIVLGFVGMIAVIIVLYGGFMWMTAGGNEEKVAKARKVLINGFIGILIILGSYSLVSFIIGRLTADLQRGGQISPEARLQGYIGGALGGGIIESHYPERNAKNIARNTKIIVTFKEEMNVADLISDPNETPDDRTDDIINIDNVQIRKAVDDEVTGPFVQGRAQFTEDFKTFVFSPGELLGSPNEPILYNVFLSSDIRKRDGSNAFGAFGTYGWQFEVSTFVDSTPPKIIGVFPTEGTETPRNVIIQIDFNEAIDPVSVSGQAPPFNNLEVRTGDGSLVEGTFSIANRYRTVEFQTDDICATNSCGGDVYCLPGPEDITVTVKAASLTSTPPEAEFPYDGVADVAANSFDGNANNEAEGQPTDNYVWSFSTSDVIDTTPPTIQATIPVARTTLVPRDTDVNARFNKVMRKSTINTTNIIFTQWPYWTGAVDFLWQNIPATLGQVFHELLPEATEQTTGMSSGIQDVYQNCYLCVGPD